MADFTTIANLRGPAGRDGSNVLPTDEAMAQTAADPQSEFATQLSATINTATDSLAPISISGYRNNRLGAAGDSITAEDGSAPVPVGMPGGAYHTRAAGASEGRLSWAGARAVGGNTVEQIVDERIPDLISANLNIGACVVLAGTNSMNSVASLTGQARAERLSALLAKLNGGYDALAAAGARPIAATIPVRSDGAAVEHAGIEWNAILRANAAARGLDIVDFYAVTAAGEGVWKTGYNRDPVHPGPLGHKAMGQALAELLFPRMGYRTIRLATSLADPDDLLTGKGLFATDSVTAGSVQTPNDGVSDGWQSFSGTGVVHSRSQDAFGTWWQRITVPASASASGLLQVNLPGAVAVGDRIRIAGRVRTGGLDALAPSHTGPQAYASCVVRGTSGNVLTIGTSAVRSDYFREGLFEQEAIVTAGANGALQVNLFVGRPPTGSGDVWAEFAQIIVTNKTARKLL